MTANSGNMPITIMPPTSPQPRTGASFFRLPGEIRNQIYEYAQANCHVVFPVQTKSEEELVTKDAYAIRERRGSNPLPLLSSRIAIALTSRQAYYEAIRPFYEDGIMAVQSGPVCSAWMASLPLTHVESIKHLIIECFDFRCPQTSSFTSPRARAQSSQEPQAAEYRLRDWKFMSAKQIRRLHVFCNLRSLKFMGRWHRYKGPPGPSTVMLNRLMALGQVLEHLEEIIIISYLHESRSPLPGGRYYWPAQPRWLLTHPEWEYSVSTVRTPRMPSTGRTYPGHALKATEIGPLGEEYHLCSREKLTRRRIDRI